MKNKKQPNNKDDEKTIKEFYESLGGHSQTVGPYVDLEKEKSRMLRNKIILILCVVFVAVAFYILGASSNDVGQASNVVKNDSEFQRGVAYQKKFTYERCTSYANAYPYLEYELGPSKVWCNFFTGDLKSREEMGIE